MSLSKIVTDANVRSHPDRPSSPDEITRDQYMRHYFVEREDPSRLRDSLQRTTYKCETVKCFIFDHKYFDTDSGFENMKRLATECDRYGLDETFRRMNIIPEIHIDRKKDEIFEILENFASDPEDKCDCLIVCILSHGDESDSVAAFDTTYPLDTVFDIFYGDKCEKMVGKPKMFIVNTCRGDKTDKGAEEQATDGGASQLLPVTADFLVFRSTCAKYVSWRNIESGSWFIQTIVTVFNENLTNDQNLDVESLFRIVKDRVAVGNDDETVEWPKQQPVTISTFRKLLFLPRPRINIRSAN